MRILSIILVFFYLFLLPIFVSADNVDVNLTVDVFACGDGVDNDSDTLIDFPFDPGCSSSSDDDERDVFACGDGIDNDNDSKIDFPDDLGCGSITDDYEGDDPVAPMTSAGASGGISRFILLDDKSKNSSTVEILVDLFNRIGDSFDEFFTDDIDGELVNHDFIGNNADRQNTAPVLFDVKARGIVHEETALSNTKNVILLFVVAIPVTVYIFALLFRVLRKKFL